MSKKSRTGATLDSFFEETGELEEVQEITLRRMLASELGAMIKKRKWTHVKLAAELRTSRPQVERLLNPQPTKSITMTTFSKAVAVLGKRLALVDA